MSHPVTFLAMVATIADQLDPSGIQAMALQLRNVRDRGGRVFVLGLGGSAGNAGHLVNDLRKLCGIESYAPTDGISEFTARANDEGLETVFSGYLAVSRFSHKDAILVLSVGGGSVENGVSLAIVQAVKEAKEIGATVLGILGRDGGYTAQHADAAVVIPTVDESLVTPLAEAFQGIVWHCVVSHPALQVNKTKW